MDVFCKIINGEIPSSKIYEDDDVLAILDISQVTKGHALVIPKEHYDSILTCPADLLHKVMDVAKRIAQADVEVLGAKGVNILSNAGEIAGQSVPHFHVHVIPRYSSEDPGFRIEMETKQIAMIDLPALAESLSEKVKN